jgi:hypothetical protein
MSVIGDIISKTTPGDHAGRDAGEAEGADAL